ncbi:MAG: hypothetical protein BWK80_00860 [Desulfobacteraceae bacterium IS3]|nr:MAG: hypothetical protein BWK80_00860 [Desulfobacteraceae bacterium IS3]
MHLKRWITALAALPFLIFAVCKGGVFFTTLVSIVCLLAMAEYFRIVFNPKGRTVSGLLILLAFITGLCMIWAASHPNACALILGLIALNLMLSAFFSLTQYSSDPFILENTAKQIQGTVYIPVLLSFLVLIRNGADGTAWLFLVLVVVFAGDTGAFYAGRRLGRHKLCPAVSPGKTIEGSVGGLAANAFFGVIMKGFFLPELPYGGLILCCLCMGAAGQAGDLFESELKRASGVKDSGKILPGHGGILDRIDALLFAAPVAYFFKEYFL